MPTCLIADDSKVIRSLFTKIMENFGYTVSEVENGEELIEHCAHDMPDLIISDWELPLVDGVDALMKIRSSKKAKQPAFVFCSYLKDPAVIEQALNAKADDFIMRPFDEDIVSSKLKLIKIMRGVR